MNKFKLLTICLFIIYAFSGYSNANYETIKLWDNPTNHREQRPELRVFFPDSSKKNQTCILICPGGSYHHLGLTNEGSEVATYFNQWGVTSVVLRYRVAMRGNHHPAMIEDFQRAMQILHNKAKEWDITRIGCIGFSAGGHLVTMGGAFSHENYLQKKGIQANPSELVPDFVCPIYPVVSMQDSIVHEKSRINLLTKNYTQLEKDKFSMEQQIPSYMPPVFLLACKDDDVVDYRNSVVLYNALIQQNIPCQFYLLEHGGHGFGAIRTKSPETKDWPLLLKAWLQENNFLEK